MDSNRTQRYNAGDHYTPQPAYGDVAKNQYNIEQSGLGTAPPAMDKPNSSGSFGRTPTAHDPEMQLTDAEVGLLRKLRTLNGAEYEAQYFDAKPTPNKASMIEKIGNPTPLAIACFGITNTLMSFVLMQVRGVEQMNLLVGTMWFTAGVINLLVGIFELLIGNTFAYTIFGSLGGYFLSMGAILTPAFGVSAAYAKHPAEFRNMMGLFNICWGAVFIVFLIVAIRSNVFMVLIFSAVSITCILSAIGDFQAADGHKEAKKNLDRVAGIFLFISSLPNWYLLFMMLAYSAGWKLKFYTGELGPNKHAHKHE